MKRVRRDGLTLLVFPHLEQAGLVCAISTRPIDVREPEGARRFVKAAGLDPERIATARQVHHGHVAEAGPETPQADGLVTDMPGRPLLLRAADCSLIVVADPVARAVGLAHAGWKGSARGIVVNLVRALHERYGAEPSRCLAGVGPTIGASRYEVGPKVPTAFLRKRAWTREYVSSSDGRLYFDLAGANTRFLLECGIPRDSIEVSGLCTYDTPDLLHSFRREGTGAGHHGMVAAWPAPC